MLKIKEEKDSNIYSLIYSTHVMYTYKNAQSTCLCFMKLKHKLRVVVQLSSSF